ncbi:MAG: two component, sigma54 specific, transcriptional regulator, Fis family [Bryobacterales bacterium]|nr:two component, sigma54 specific, transcriptional regulator, Fis family [Bryobacterales bacterium]
MKPGAILVVDDEKSLRRVVQVQLEQRGHRVSTAENVAEALVELNRNGFEVVVTDLRMPGRFGLELLKDVRRLYSRTQVIVLTAFATVENAVEAMQAGAFHYVTKPVNFNELILVVERALEHSRLMEEVSTLRETLNEKYGFENIIGRSGALMTVLDIASRAARSSSTVLIEGETGTGKELLARAIHVNSRRKDEPFVTVNCGAIPKDLLESELFGYRKGAFTGATDNKRGRVEACDGGTLFLDEIGELPLELQVKLLRLVQEGEIQKIGALDPVKVDVRIVAATHRNLRRMAEDGDFREDLYYRLAVIPVTVPPLRERVEDIAVLVRHFWTRSLQKHGRDDLSLPDALLPLFSRYHWPGNIRELENVMERIVVLSRGPAVTPEDIPEFVRREQSLLDSLQIELPPNRISLEAVEKELIVRALERYDGNQTKAAEYLDLTRKTLIYRMEKHGIRKE